MRSLFLIVGLLLPVSIGADEAPRIRLKADPAPSVSLKVDWQTTTHVGALVKIDARKSDAQTIVWHIPPDLPSNVWDFAEKGQVIYFTPPEAAKYTFILIGSSGGASGPPAVQMMDVTVDARPNPNPNPPVPPVVPTPDPIPPQPTPPQPKNFGLDAVTSGIVLSARPPFYQAKSLQFAGNYRLVAAKLTDATKPYANIGAAQAELASMNRATAGTDLAAWTAGVFKPLGDRMAAMGAAKAMDLTSIADVAEAFVEIASGFARAGSP